MTGSRDIEALQALAQLLLDHRLSQLRMAADCREKSRIQIAALETASELTDPGLAAEQVALRYQLWADARRAELNTVLARQTAEWMVAREEARHAFGRAEALRGIAGRLVLRR